MNKKIKIYLPITKDEKSNIRGFWLENKKLYYDYIKIIETDISKIEYYKRKYNQLAIFYICNDIAYIYHNQYNIEILTEKKQFIFIYGICNIKKQLKRLLYKYNGYTLYIKDCCILAEVWQK